MNERLVLISLAIVGLSGLPGLVVARRTQVSQLFCSLLACAGCVGGLWGTVECLLDGTTPVIWDWFLPIGRFSILLDTLSCIFLLPLFLISFVGSIYGIGYWKQGAGEPELDWANLFAETWPGYWKKSDHSATGPRLRFFYGTLTAAMGLLIISRDGVLFLLAWEAMALSAFFLVSTEDEDDDVLAAGWLFLAASHLATLFLFGMFSLLYRVHGTFDIAAIAPDQTSPAMITAIFVLAVLGFGLKAGIMPLHIWLPSAHASAPSHVSALMSGVLIKMGVYGLVRVTSLLPDPPLWWGLTLLLLGAVSGIFALVLAIGQLDVKRTLAYSSIENIGVIFMGLGLALAGRAEGKPEWTILGMGGVLLHVWNHALFKSLLFYCAGSVIHATGTRSLDLMGGLAKSMRWTSLAFLVGALSACGLPPLSGFVSELFIYLGIFKNLVVVDGVPPLKGFSFAAAALAMVGALAVTCFVQLYGVIFLGSGRSQCTEHAHESPPTMLVPMILPIFGSVAIGVAPWAVIGVIDQGVAAWMEPARTAAERAAEQVSLASLAPLSWISGIAMLLAGLLAVLVTVFRWRLKAAPVGVSGTWDCGYAQPTARMQYTAASFAEILVQLFKWVLQPRVTGARVNGLFPQKASFHIQALDIVLNGFVEPVTGFLAWSFARLRLLQQGVIQVYLLYIFLIIVVLLIWA